MTLPKFVHRRNSDGGFDTICSKCFLTVVTSRTELGLKEFEDAHVCSEYRLELMQRAKELVETGKCA